MFSEEIKNLLLPSDYFIAILYLAIFALLFHFVTPQKQPYLRKIALVSLVLKAIAVIVNCLLIQNYWKTGDSLSYFSEAETLSKLVQKNISNIKYLVLPLESYTSKIGVDNSLSSTISGVSNESNFMVSRFASVFYFLGFGRFLIVNLLFSFWALIGQIKIIAFFSKYYPLVNKKFLTIAVIVSPSLLFYASPLYKETLCIGSIGMALYFVENLIISKKHLFKYLLGLVFSCFVILVTKNYLFYGLFVTVVLVFLILFLIRVYKKRLTNKIIILSIFVFGVIILIENIDRFDGLIVPVVENLNHFQDLYVDPDNEGSTFKIGEMDLSFIGLCKQIPVAIYTSMFRPHLWEITKPILILNSLESVFLFLLVLYILLFRFFDFVRNLKHGITLGLLVYSLVVFTVVGLTTFNFGTMVRYKNPGLIFFNIFLVLCLIKNKQTTSKSISLNDSLLL